MSAGNTIIGRNTLIRIGERISSDSARLTLPVRRDPQSHSPQSRSASETRRAPAFKRLNLTPLSAAFVTKARAPASHMAKARLKTIGSLGEGLELATGVEC